MRSEDSLVPQLEDGDESYDQVRVAGNLPITLLDERLGDLVLMKIRKTYLVKRSLMRIASGTEGD
jgi:hypothetical protein